MAFNQKNIVIVALGIAFAGVAGALGFYFTKGSAPPPAAASVKISELIGRSYPVVQATDALETPTRGAAVVVHIRQGAEVKVLGIVEGDGWLQVQPSDGRLAYIPVSAIPSILPGAAPPATPAAPVASAPAPIVAPAPPPPDAGSARTEQQTDGGEVATPPPADLVQFDPANQSLVAIRPTGLFLAPNVGAPQAYTVQPGTKVAVVALSRDGRWAWVSVADGVPAYIATADLAGP